VERENNGKERREKERKGRACPANEKNLSRAPAEIMLHQ